MYSNVLQRKRGSKLISVIPEISSVSCSKSWRTRGRLGLAHAGYGWKLPTRPMQAMWFLRRNVHVAYDYQMTIIWPSRSPKSGWMTTWITTMMAMMTMTETDGDNARHTTHEFTMKTWPTEQRSDMDQLKCVARHWPPPLLDQRQCCAHCVLRHGEMGWTWTSFWVLEINGRLNGQQTPSVDLWFPYVKCLP